LKNPTSPSTRRQLGEVLLSSGHITQQQLDAALAYRKENNCKLGQALTALKILTEEQLSDALRRQGKMLCINLSPGIVDQQIATELGEERSRNLRSVAINRIAGITTVAMEDPANVLFVDEIALVLKTQVLAVYAEPQKIAECINTVFRNTGEKPDLLRDIMDSAELGGAVNLDVKADLGEEDDGELDQPVINMIRSVFEEAFEARASDIHLEPRRDSFVVRFRVDGALYQRLSLPRAWARPCLARLKVIAKLDIAQKRLPQDGRAQIEINGKRVDLRIATTPTMFDEGAVIRILDGGRETPDLDKLDLEPSQLVRLERAIECHDGFVLATGPTGSGKTTTLYAILARLNTPDTKIITIEDPVENEMETITQINAKPKIGLTFAAGLRSILRQDPDVVLLGEIRDEETAGIAVQAALTGHLVLSTLHTVGAAETITRLEDMGVEKYLVADTLRGIISQRLARRICGHCKKEVKPGAETLKRLEIEQAEGQTFYQGEGCDRCLSSGFRGRIALFEILQMTPELCTLVRKGCSTHELNAEARASGLLTMREDGLRKALQGKTTLSEVLSITAKA
jgi:type II secretory ATPase GspE/PulE/Tfp pilus assembly ATPase PilB-like protein